MMNFSNHRRKRHSQDNQNPSRVLLVCVYDTIVLEITNQTVYSRFSTFGTIVKILIFEKGEVTKFFLQYTSVSSAQNAKLALDGTKLYEAICKMSIYYSNFLTVDLKHETSEGIILEPTVYPLQSNFMSLSNQCFQPFNYEFMTTYFHPFSPVLSKPFSEFQCYKEQEKQENTKSVLKQRSHNISIQQLQQTIENDINCLLRSQEKKRDQIVETKTYDVCKQNEKSCFLSFELQNQVSNRAIYNLFSNFGNLSFIKQTKKCVYLKFRNIQYAAMAKNYLSNFTLQGNHLVFIDSNEAQLDQPKSEQYTQITFFDQSHDRFTSGKSITINPPSHILHVSSLKRDICRVDNLHKIFEEYGTVQRVQILSHSHQKNMALVKFATFEGSFHAISEMHGKNVAGRKIQISFTKSKLL